MHSVNSLIRFLGFTVVIMRATNRKKKQFKLLEALLEAKPERRSNILHFLNTSGLETLGEATYNTLFRNSGLTPKERDKLKGSNLSNFSRTLYTISKKSTPAERRRRLLIKVNQKGEGLGTLLSIALPLLGSLLFRKK